MYTFKPIFIQVNNLVNEQKKRRLVCYFAPMHSYSYSDLNKRTQKNDFFQRFIFIYFYRYWLDNDLFAKPFTGMDHLHNFSSFGFVKHGRKKYLSNLSSGGGLIVEKVYYF